MQRNILDEAVTTVEDVEEPITEMFSRITIEQSPSRLFMILFLFRLWNSVFLATWFDPDETWQSLEVAHNMVFGVGALTWEWRIGIRGASHPVMFAALYKLIQVFGLEHTSLIVGYILMNRFMVHGPCKQSLLR